MCGFFGFKVPHEMIGKLTCGVLPPNSRMQSAHQQRSYDHPTSKAISSPCHPLLLSYPPSAAADATAKASDSAPSISFRLDALLSAFKLFFRAPASQLAPAFRVGSESQG